MQDTNKMLVYAVTRRMLEQAKQQTGELLQEVPIELMDDMESIHLDLAKIWERLLGMENRICASFGVDLNAKAVVHSRPKKKFTIDDRIEQMIVNGQIDPIPDHILQHYEKQFSAR